MRRAGGRTRAPPMWPLVVREDGELLFCPGWSKNTSEQTTSRSVNRRGPERRTLPGPIQYPCRIDRTVIVVIRLGEFPIHIPARGGAAIPFYTDSTEADYRCQ